MLKVLTVKLLIHTQYLTLHKFIYFSTKPSTCHYTDNFWTPSLWCGKSYKITIQEVKQRLENKNIQADYLFNIGLTL